MSPTRNVPFLDLRAAYLELKSEIDDAVSRVLDSGHYILGETVERFESAFAAYVGARHCIGVGNGLDALTLSLAAAGIGPGDEVLVPSNTFIATWLAVSHVGASPVPVEPDARSYVVDAEAFERALTPRTRAMIPVHLYGYPVDLTRIAALAKRHGLFLLDDAAQAHGASVAGRPVGGLGANATAWSFYPGKNLGALGDGGAVTTDDSDLATRLRKLRNYGSTTKYVHDDIGWNSRLDPIQAAILSVKLRRLDSWNERRRSIADTYLRALSDAPGITIPIKPDNGLHAWHLFVIQCSARDALREALAARGVQTLIHYPTPPHQQQAYAKSFSGARYPVSEVLHSRLVSLPIGPHLAQEDVEFVVSSVREHLR